MHQRRMIGNRPWNGLVDDKVDHRRASGSQGSLGLRTEFLGTSEHRGQQRIQGVTFARVERSMLCLFCELLDGWLTETS